MKFIIVSLLIVFAVIVGVHSAPQLIVSENGALDGVLAQVEENLQPILSPGLLNIVLYVIKALANGNPLNIPLSDLLNVESQLRSVAKNTILPDGELVLALVGGKSNNPIASVKQINTALENNQAILSTILNPKNVKTVNELINGLLNGGTLSNAITFVTNLLGGGIVGGSSGGLVDSLSGLLGGLLDSILGLLGL